LAAALNRASWYDLISLQFDRFRRAGFDAPQFEEEFLSQGAESYRQLANSIADQPTHAPIERRQFEIGAPSSVALVKSATEEIRFTVKSVAGEPKPLWIITEFNPDWLKVVGQSIQPQHEMPSGFPWLTTSNYRIPNFSAEFEKQGIGATTLVPANGNSEVRLTVERRPSKDAGGSTKLIVKALTADSLVRKDINVTLPGRESLELTVDAPNSYWEFTRPCEMCPADGIKILPLPNHPQSFAFNVVNRAKVKKTLEVHLLIPNPAKWPDGPVFLPPGVQPKATVNDLLKPFAPLRELTSAPLRVDLPDTAQPARIIAAGDKLDPDANLLVPANSDPEKFKPIFLRHGLLVLLHDVQTNEVTIRRIQIVPQRPGRYLNVTAAYDAETERVEFAVKANDPNSLLPDGVDISLDMEGISAPKDKKRSGKITKASKEAERLYAYLAADAPQVVTAQVHVDNNPRAFMFRIPRGVTNLKLPLFKGPEVRIVRPMAGTAFNAAVKVVPTQIQVDAAEGLFDLENSTAFVQVGIDSQRDGELHNDAFSTLYSDRQVEIEATRLSPDGTLSLEAKVSDFNRQLPTEGLSDLEVDLLARVVINGESIWSDPVTIKLDGAPPEIHVDDMPKQVISGSDLEIHIRPTQDDRSGIAQVEALFETAGGATTDEVKWEPAKPDGNGGWVAVLKTAKAGLGPKAVLIRGTDNVGNVSAPVTENIEIVPKPDTESVSAKETPPDVTNTVSGRAFYDNQPASASLTLVSAAGATVATKNSNDAGEFTFFKVPPGEYVLNAKSLAAIRNKRRTAEVKLNVLPRPQAASSVRVNLE